MQGVKPQSSKYWKYSIIFARSQTSKLKILKIQHKFCKESNLKSKYSNYFAKNQTLNQNIPNILQGVKPQKSKYWKYSIIWPPMLGSITILIFILYGSRDELAIKNDHFCAWRDFKKKFCGACRYDKWKFKPKISPIFNFDRAHQSWISGILGVNYLPLTPNFVS